MHQLHTIAPLFDGESQILILGSFPSVKSREDGFFYGNPLNRFWRVMAAVLDATVPQDHSQKRELLLNNKIALWDVVGSCEIEGSSDTSIKNVIPNDIAGIVSQSRIEKIYLNGRTAEKYYKKYIEKTVRIKAYCLPSTSPANAAWNSERLCKAWKIIIQ